MTHRVGRGHDTPAAATEFDAACMHTPPPETEGAACCTPRYTLVCLPQARPVMHAVRSGLGSMHACMTACHGRSFRGRQNGGFQPAMAWKLSWQTGRRVPASHVVVGGSS